VYAVNNPEIQQSIYPVSMDYGFPFTQHWRWISKDNNAYGYGAAKY